jgi:hypothetical protein
VKLKRREFLRGILPALLGGKKVVEEMLRPAEEPEPKGETIEEPVHRIDTESWGASGSVYPGGYIERVLEMEPVAFAPLSDAFQDDEGSLVVWADVNKIGLSIELDA